MTRESFTRSFFLIIFGACLYGLYGMFAAFWTPILLAILATVVLMPLQKRWVQPYVKSSPSWQAFVSVSGVLVFWVVPIFFIVWQGVVESSDAAPKIQETVARAMSWFKSGQFETSSVWQSLRAYIPSNLSLESFDLQTRLSELVQSIVELVAKRGTSLIKNTFDFFFGVFVFLFTLFFLLRDGEKMFRQFESLLPFSAAEKKRVVVELEHLITVIVRGNLLTSLVQSLIATLGFLIVGTEAVTLLACLTFFASFIPMVGTALVWLPVALFYLLTGVIWKGVFLVIWGGVVIGLADNFLRPLLVGGDELPFFWLFFAIMGGLQFFGLVGLIMGPLLVGIVPVLISLYREHFLKPTPSGKS